MFGTAMAPQGGEGPPQGQNQSRYSIVTATLALKEQLLPKRECTMVNQSYLFLKQISPREKIGVNNN